jgi:hypothetical protein
MASKAQQTQPNTSGAGGTGEIRGTRFFVIMAIIMVLVIVVGFSRQAIIGISSFDAAWPFHVHGVIFMAWTGLYLAQHVTIAKGNRALHAKLGKLAYPLIPAMLAAGGLVMVVSMRTNGGPFFFAINEFFFGDLAVLLCFGGLALAALRSRRNFGWHRRLMLCSMAVLTGPAFGRLLPLPLVIPYSWIIASAPCLIFPVIGMLADKRANGAVHPAYWWGAGVYAAGLAAAFALAYTPFGYAVTEWVIAGTPGAERPMEAFLPPGFGT